MPRVPGWLRGSANVRPQQSRTPSPLDVPTLSFVAICIAALLGSVLIVAWVQQRNVRALAWWGAAYLIGASSMALWSAPAPLFTLPPEVPAALIFVACGMIWNGVRLFHGRRLLPVAAFAGAVGWLLLCQLPELCRTAAARALRSAPVVVATYTFFIAFELGRERRKSLYSRTAAGRGAAAACGDLPDAAGDEALAAGRLRRRMAGACSRWRRCSTRSAPPSSCC